MKKDTSNTWITGAKRIDSHVSSADVIIVERDRASNLLDQMQALRQIGFRDVDCFYKYGIFALLGGTK